MSHVRSARPARMRRLHHPRRRTRTSHRGRSARAGLNTSCLSICLLEIAICLALESLLIKSAPSGLRPAVHGDECVHGSPAGHASDGAGRQPGVVGQPEPRRSAAGGRRWCDCAPPSMPLDHSIQGRNRSTHYEIFAHEGPQDLGLRMWVPGAGVGWAAGNTVMLKLAPEMLEPMPTAGYSCYVTRVSGGDRHETGTRSCDHPVEFGASHIVVLVTAIPNLLVNLVSSG